MVCASGVSWGTLLFDGSGSDGDFYTFTMISGGMKSSNDALPKG